MRVGDSRLQLAEDWSDDDGATFQVTNSFDGENILAKGLGLGVLLRYSG